MGIYIWRSQKLDRTWMTVIYVQCIAVWVEPYGLVCGNKGTKWDIDRNDRWKEYIIYNIIL